MKGIFSALILFSMASISLLSCNQQGEAKEVDSPKVETTTTSTISSDHTFDPGPGWKMVWADEFDADTLNTKNWNRQVEPAGRFNDEWQGYTNSRDNAFIENGQLVIKAIHKSDTHGMDQYTSARLNTANKQIWKYGKIAARIKLPQGNGMWPAFWMLGANINENGGDTPWPQCGEIDILEFYGSKDPGVVEGNLHYANADNKHTMSGAIPYKLDKGKFADAFHIFELEWNAKQVIWSVDGKTYASTQITAEEMSEFHKEFFLLLNLAVGGAYAGRPDDSTQFPQYMFVDWVRVFQE